MCLNLTCLRLLDLAPAVYATIQEVKESKPGISRRCLAVVIVGCLMVLLVIVGLVAAVIVLVSDLTGRLFFRWLQ